MNSVERGALVDVLIYHQRLANSGCSCGWAVWGESYAEHVAAAYEETLRRVLPQPVLLPPKAEWQLGAPSRWRRLWRRLEGLQ